MRSASFQTGVSNNNGGNGVVSDVFNYEQTGLTLKFKPLVFPNQDVQVAMEIESKDVAAGGTANNPIFTERTIKGTARIQNNKTLLLASVAQGSERNSRSGLPLLGLVPVLGRLFSTPKKDNSQVDIVISVTPRVIRAPAILPEDEIERDTGSLAVPTNNSLEALIFDEDRQEMLAAARRVPTNPFVQLPDAPADSPVYVKAGSAVNEPKTAAEPANTATAKSTEPASSLRPIDNGIKTLQLNQTSDTSMATKTSEIPATAVEPAPEVTSSAPAVALRLGSDLTEMKVGDKIKIPVMIDGSGIFGSAVLGLKFDAKKLAVRSVSYGDLFGAGIANTTATPFLNQNGKLYVSFTAKSGQDVNPRGILAYIEIEALAAGRPDIVFDRDMLNVLTGDGKNFAVKVQE